MTHDLKIGTLQARDGMPLHYEHWSPPEHKATLVFVHGMGEHCGRYRPLIRFFNERGCRVWLYDQRGHGRSGGRRVFVKRFETLLEDLDDFLEFSRREGQDGPLFLAGHSFGGQIILNYLAARPAVFQAAAAASPNLEVALTMPKWQERLGRMVLPLWPQMKLKNLTDPSQLSHDPQVVADYLNDPLVSDYVTLGIGAELLKNLETIFEKADTIQTPLLMLHGLADAYCSPGGTKRFYNELQLEQKRLKLYEGKYHELLNEVGKEEIYEEMDGWFRSFIGA